MKHTSHLVVALLAELNIVDADQPTVGIFEKATYLIHRGYSHREVLAGLTTWDNLALKIEGISKEILRDVFRCACGR